MRRNAIFLLLISLFSALPAAADELASPLAPDLAATLRTILEVSARPATMVKPEVPVPGWPVVHGGDWSYQYPPSWRLVSSSPFSMEVANEDGSARYIFVQLYSFPGMPSHQEMGNAVFANFAGDVPVRVLSSTSKNLFPQLGLSDGSGVAQMWIVRWLHPQRGRMIAFLALTMLSRGPLSTSAQWTLMGAPENAFASVHRDVFMPMELAAHFTIPKGESPPSDRDGDGVADEADNYPDDPARW